MIKVYYSVNDNVVYGWIDDQIARIYEWLDENPHIIVVQFGVDNDGHFLGFINKKDAMLFKLWVEKQ